jgi:hypothetical protein
MRETQWRHWLSRIPMNHFTNVRRSSGRRGNRPGAIQPALLQCQAESLEARLLLSVTAPASAIGRIDRILIRRTSRVIPALSHHRTVWTLTHNHPTWRTFPKGTRP